ncbi:MAG: flagellar hook-associated protein 3, partial [Synergistaceae bacterium]|jgi:flagellar hook-associated protein 3 FlgL|nr:flagellar hook-associated protein 3 [Synergistaceae bacterium]
METGQVSMTGRDVFPLDETTNYLKSFEVPLDFQWEGRNELLEFSVGWRTIKIRIPEEWEDEIRNGQDDPGDYNRFRDPGEPLRSYSLTEIADLINNSEEVMGSADKLIKATVVTDMQRGVQYLQIKSLTGEPVRLVGWQETDVQSLARGVNIPSAGVGVTTASDGVISVRFGDGVNYDIDIPTGSNIQDIANELNSLSGARLWAAVKLEGGVETLDIVAREPGALFNVELSGGVSTLLSGTTSVASEAIWMNNDHTHMGLAEMLGLETSLKSAEFDSGFDMDTVTDPLAIKIVSGTRNAVIKIADDANLTLEELADRISGICGDWLDVFVETDGDDGSNPGDPMGNSGDNEEKSTQRLVIRTKDGAPFAVYDATDLGAGRYAEQLGISSAAVVPNIPVTFPSATPPFDNDMPATLEVTVGEHVFKVKVCVNNTPTFDLIAEQIVQQVNDQYGGKLLALDKINPTGTPPVANNIAIYSLTGEPLRVVDKGYGDPDYKDYTGGIAMQLGIAAGMAGAAGTVPDSYTVSALDAGTMRISVMGHSIGIPVIAGDTMLDVANRIREYAGSWLDVSFTDTNVDDPGGFVQLALAAKDGSAVTVFDVSGNTAEYFGLTNALVSDDMAAWAPLPGESLSITVNGATHVIDLWNDTILPAPGAATVNDIDELAAMINTRFQGQDIRAEILTDNASPPGKRLAIYSPKGYSFEIDATNAPGLTFPSPPGYNSPKSASATGPYNQVVTRRTGDNQKQIDFFGVMDNLIDTVEGGNVDGLSDIMIGELDNWMTTLLKCRAVAGALISRYQTTESRYVANRTGYTDLHNNTVGVDLAETITNYEMASGIYQASLAAIARIIQPTLLDFLR